jgi:hypothetical protein
VVAVVRLRGAAPDASVEDDEPTARLVRPRRRARRG